MRQFAMTWLEDEHVLVVVNMAIGLRCVEALQDTYTHIHTLIYIHTYFWMYIYIHGHLSSVWLGWDMGFNLVLPHNQLLDLVR